MWLGAVLGFGAGTFLFITCVGILPELVRSRLPPPSLSPPLLSPRLYYVPLLPIVSSTDSRLSASPPNGLDSSSSTTSAYPWAALWWGICASSLRTPSSRDLIKVHGCLDAGKRRRMWRQGYIQLMQLAYLALSWATASVSKGHTRGADGQGRTGATLSPRPRIKERARKEERKARRHASAECVYLTRVGVEIETEMEREREQQRGRGRRERTSTGLGGAGLEAPSGRGVLRVRTTSLCTGMRSIWPLKSSTPCLRAALSEPTCRHRQPPRPIDSLYAPALQQTLLSASATSLPLPPSSPSALPVRRSGRPSPAREEGWRVKRRARAERSQPRWSWVCGSRRRAYKGLKDLLGLLVVEDVTEGAGDGAVGLLGADLGHVPLNQLDLVLDVVRHSFFLNEESKHCSEGGGRERVLERYDHYGREIS